MDQKKATFRIIIFLALIVFSIPISMGCLESPLGSAVNDDMTEFGDTTLPTDSGTVVDTTDPDDPPPANTASVLPRNSNDNNTDPIHGLLSIVNRLVTRLLGGTVSLLEMTLQVPPMSLNKNTNITVEMPDPELYLYDFGPDGLQFNVPATITISYDNADLSGRNESNIRLAWWDENSQKWVDMPCTVDYSANTVTGTIEHFSSYGLISD